MNGPEPTDKVTPEHVRRVLLAFVALERKAIREDDAPFPSAHDSPLWHATDMCDLLAEAANDDGIIETTANERPEDHDCLQKAAYDFLHSFSSQVNGERYAQSRFWAAAEHPEFVRAFISACFDSACRLLRSPLGLAAVMARDARTLRQAAIETEDPEMRPILERARSVVQEKLAEAARGKSLADMAGEGEEWAAIVLKYERERAERVLAQAATLPIHFSSELPVPAVTGSEIILVHPDATPEQLANAVWLFLWAARGIREDGIEMEAALRPLALHLLEKHRNEKERQTPKS